MSLKAQILLEGMDPIGFIDVALLLLGEEPFEIAAVDDKHFFDRLAFVFAKGEMAEGHWLRAYFDHLFERLCFVHMPIACHTIEFVSKKFLEDEHVGERIVCRYVNVHVERVAQVLEFVHGKLASGVERLDDLERADIARNDNALIFEHLHIERGVVCDREHVFGFK